MQTVEINQYPIIVPKDSAFRIQTPDDQIKMHALILAVAKRGGGKTVALTSLMKSLKKDKALDRVILISPTYESNKDMFKGLPIDDEDIYHDPYDVRAVDDIVGKVQKEMDEWKAYKEKMKLRNKLMNALKASKSASDVYKVDPELMIDAFNYDVIGQEEPKHKWNGKRPAIALLADDCQGSPLLNSPKFQNLCLRHRHVGGGLGISIFMACQNFKARTGGMPQSIRDNVTHVLIFRTKNSNVVKQICEEISDDITEEEFLEAYDIATRDDEHDFLFVDFHPKRGREFKFRKNFDTYLVLPKRADGGRSHFRGDDDKSAKRRAGGPADGHVSKSRQIPGGAGDAVR